MKFSTKRLTVLMVTVVLSVFICGFKLMPISNGNARWSWYGYDLGIVDMRRQASDIVGSEPMIVHATKYKYPLAIVIVLTGFALAMSIKNKP